MPAQDITTFLIVSWLPSVDESTAFSTKRSCTSACSVLNEFCITTLTSASRKPCDPLMPIASHVTVKSPAWSVGKSKLTTS